MTTAMAEIPTPMQDPTKLTWPEFHDLSRREKSQYLFTPSGRLHAVLYSQQFTRPMLDHLFGLAETVRSAWDKEDLKGYVKTLLATNSCVLYFTQPSTRTYTSFSLAARATGMMCEEIRDPEMSSAYKGESEVDTLLTLSELADAVVMRQSDPIVIERFAYEVVHRGLPTRIINGGSGSDQHPTQALLEIYTLVSHFDLPSTTNTFTVGMVGDLKRSRTARSLAYLLALYPRIRQVFIAPDELQMGEDLTEFLDEHDVRYERTDAFDERLPELDAIYMMRMQDEYGTTSEETRARYDDFRLTTDRVARMKENACILHPLPRRSELPIEVDADPRARYWEAVNRGKFVRIALLLHMFGKDDVEKIMARRY